MKIYLDNAATTPLNQETKNYIISILDDYYNPSSAYQEGRNIRNKIDKARKNIADFIHADESNILFTSGGSASNTLAKDIKTKMTVLFCTLLLRINQF